MASLHTHIHTHTHTHTPTHTKTHTASPGDYSVGGEPWDFHIFNDVYIVSNHSSSLTG